MTIQTAEALVALLKGVALAMFTCIGLGGIIIANNTTMLMVSIVVSIICWVVAKFIEVYAEQLEDENLYDN